MPNRMQIVYEKVLGERSKLKVSLSAPKYCRARINGVAICKNQRLTNAYFTVAHVPRITAHLYEWSWMFLPQRLCSDGSVLPFVG